MSIIRVLPETIANQIAAGEVIERPASIVKELVENALDAGARSIDITVAHGGKSFIRVADDGHGMDPEDARLAFQRHATSKITCAEDLERIGSFGFRGEALPSIAAVSRLRLITRAKADPAGTEVVMEGGNLRGVQEHPCRVGTVMEARDLFYNTPARRKFLKSDSTEMGRIQEMITRLALSAGPVRFTFQADGKRIFELAPSSDLKPRVTALLGPETGEWLLPVEKEKEGIRIRGFIGKPSVTRANRSGQSLFVNGRWVRSPAFSHVLQAGYHGLLMHARYPAAVLFLELDLGRVDVNVHPTKQEVRISGEGEIWGLVEEAVRESLGRTAELAPSLKVSPRPAAFAAQKSYRLLSDEALVGVALDAPLAAEPIPIRDALRITRILGQIHHTFIVAETEEGMLLLDQHAAHERVVFEALLKNLSSGKAERQVLLLEEILELGPRQMEPFKESLPVLEKIGFEIEPFGERSFLIRAVPAAFGPVNAVTLIATFLEEQEDGKSRTVLEDHREMLAALCACKKGSVKARDPLEPLAIQRLLERLARCENPFTCPHGRPVFFTHSFADLERQFKRA